MKPRDLLRATKPQDAQPSGEVGVLVALRTSKPDLETRKRLSGLGLNIDRVVGNKLIGRINASGIPALRADPSVAEAETAAPLKPHRRR